MGMEPPCPSNPAVKFCTLFPAGNKVQNLQNLVEGRRRQGKVSRYGTIAEGAEAGLRAAHGGSLERLVDELAREAGAELALGWASVPEGSIGSGGDSINRNAGDSQLRQRRVRGGGVGDQTPPQADKAFAWTDTRFAVVLVLVLVALGVGLPVAIFSALT